jgi:hypothetical protein
MDLSKKLWIYPKNYGFIQKIMDKIFVQKTLFFLSLLLNSKKDFKKNMFFKKSFLFYTNFV